MDECDPAGRTAGWMFLPTEPDRIEESLQFDPSITLGALINAVVLLVGFVVAFTRIGGRIDLLSLRIKSIEEVISDTKAFDRRLTAAEVGLTTAQRDISDLRHGNGFITTSHRKSIDGEYP